LCQIPDIPHSLCRSSITTGVKKPLLKHVAKGFTKKETEAEGQSSVNNDNKMTYATLYGRAT